PLCRPIMGRVPVEENQRYFDSTTRTTYKSLLLLGKGGFAKCYKVRNESTREHSALKVIDRKNMSANQYSKVLREINIHKGLDHPHIVRLMSTFEDDSNVYIVMELCSEKSLLNLINDNTRISEQDSQYYLRGIVSAVTFLLSYDIIHRDIKPGNILLKESGNRTVVKLADFGLACMMKEVATASVSGTPNYLAPEVLARKGHSVASEAWSIGCLLFCMVVGMPPFDSSSIQETYRRIEHGEYKYPSHIMLSPALVSLINGLLMISVPDRLSIHDISSSAFMRISSTRSSLTNLSNTSRSCSIAALRSPSARYNYSGVSMPSSPTHSKYSPTPPPLPPRPPSFHTTTNYGGGPLVQSTYGFDSTRSQSHHDSSSSMSISPSLPSLIFSDLDVHASTISSLLNGSLKLSIVKCDSPLHVSKWVDYSNKYGFGCLLSDGTTSVKFNSGEIVSVNRDGVGVYMGSSSMKPAPLNLRDPHINKMVELTNSYKLYMETQLAKAAKVEEVREYRRWSDTPTPFITHYSKKKNSLMIILSDGTAQVNFTSEHVKVVISPDTSSTSLISVIASSGRMHTYRASSLSTSRGLSEDFLSILRNSNAFISDEMFYLRSSRSYRPPPLTTSC
ncbi:hypothetical protein PFISCL1PPCAC_8057, partial [Pristionchus fissidentatus]